MKYRQGSSMKKVRWGVLSTAKIGLNKVLPAMQQGQYCTIAALGSRDGTRAAEAAATLNIPKTYDSYEALLADPEIDAIYNPLPNHLHIPWTIKALEAGKHVLCEKPIALSVTQARELADTAARFPHLKVMEAFMYRFHPQWERAKAIATSGELGEVKTIHSFFSYFNNDPDNIRNMADLGGGALMDIGCYNISLSRFIFDAEPQRVLGIIERDPQFGTDRLTSGILDFGHGTATFTCSTQLTGYQRAQIYGTTGRIELEIPFNAPPDRPSRIWQQQGQTINEITFDITDQYTLQGDRFAQAILNDTPVPTALTDAIANMTVIEAIVESARQNAWIPIR